MRHPPSEEYVKCAARQNWDQIARDIKPVCTAAAVDAAAARFEEFADKWGSRYPAAIGLWRSAWEEFIAFLAYDVEIRTVICTTNVIESLSARFRRAVRAKGHFPTDQAALKCLYLVARSLDPSGTAKTRWMNRWTGTERVRHHLPGPTRPGRKQPANARCRPPFIGQTLYPYFVCSGRHGGSGDCTRQAVLIEDVERLIESYYDRIQISGETRQSVAGMMHAQFDQLMAADTQELSRLAPDRDRLDDERTKLLLAHYAGAVPLDLLKKEQDRIGAELDYRQPDRGPP